MSDNDANDLDEKVVGEGSVGESLFDDTAKAAEAKVIADKAIADKAISDKAAADAKAAEEAKAKEAKPEEKKAAPEKYDFKLPEGSKLSKAEVDEVAAFSKEQGLSQEQAQKILERESKLADGRDAKNLAQLQEATVQWLEAAKADKEIGGEAFPKHAELAKRVVERFGTKEFKDELNRTGLGNHPELVRVFTRIGKSMSDDQFVQPGSQTAEKTDLATKFYGAGKKE